MPQGTPRWHALILPLPYLALSSPEGAQLITHPAWACAVEATELLSPAKLRVGTGQWGPWPSVSPQEPATWTEAGAQAPGLLASQTGVCGPEGSAGHSSSFWVVRCALLGVGSNA